MIESVMAIRLSTGFFSPATLLQYRPAPSKEEGVSCFHYASRRVFSLNNTTGSGYPKHNNDYLTKKLPRKNRTRATAEYVDSASDPEKQTGKSRYHPKRLEPICHIILETPGFHLQKLLEPSLRNTDVTGSTGDGVLENILWPDIPYITDQNGIKEDENVMQSELMDALQQVIVGSDTMEMIKEMELMGLSDSDFETEDDESAGEDDSDVDGDEGEDDVEVNNKGTLMLTGSTGDGVLENILWPDIPYITDQNGNLYFQVKEDEDVMQSVTSENNYVQVIVGSDTMEMIKEMELMGLSDSDFETEDDESAGEDDSDVDGDEGEDDVE
ncbi:hypothetical protein Bca52824_000742, partial [Brassica carinata]